MSYFNTTLKRNSKLDLSKSDLLKLVSMLEGELQAREIAIAVLKSEQIKRLLNPPKLPLKSSGFRAVKNLSACGSTSTAIDLSNPEQTIKYSADPLTALSRDSFAIYEPTFDYATTLALFNLKVYQLENFINHQNALRAKFCEQLKAAEERYDKALNDLEGERLKNKRLELKYEDYDRVKLEEEVKTLTQSIEDTKTREKQIIISLLSERKHLIIKLIEERHQNEELRQVLCSEKGKIAEMVEGLEDESKRSLQMEAELEKYLNDFDKERNSYKVQLQLSEAKNAELQKEIDLLRSTTAMDGLKIHSSAGPRAAAASAAIVENVDSGKWNIGEGVRSSIVTMPVSTKVHSLSSVSAVAHPKASVAQPVTKSIPSTNTILPPPSIPVPVPQPKQQQQPPQSQQIATATMKKAVAVDSAYVISKPLNDSIICQGEVGVETVEGTRTDHTVKQNIMFYENSAAIQSKPIIASAAPPPTLTATMRKAGARVPPPVPPNKPSIKPVLPSQAILHQNKIKDANNLLNKANSQTKGPVSSTALPSASAGISKS